MALTNDSENAPRKVSLPFSNADLLENLYAHGANAGELAQPSDSEVGLHVSFQMIG